MFYTKVSNINTLWEYTFCKSANSNTKSKVWREVGPEVSVPLSVLYISVYSEVDNQEKVQILEINL